MFRTTHQLKKKKTFSTKKWKAPYHQEIRVVQVPSLEQRDAAGLVGDAAEVLQPLLRRQRSRGIRELQEGSDDDEPSDVCLEVRSLKTEFLKYELLKTYLMYENMY